MRKRKLNELKAQEKERSSAGFKVNFSVGQEFGSKAEVKQLVDLHAIETRRNLVIVKNDRIRLRAKYEGFLKNYKNGEFVGGKQPLTGQTSNKGGVGEGSGALKYKGNGKKTSKATPPNKDKKSHHRIKHIECQWALQVSKIPNSETWSVRTYNHKHDCLESRLIRQCTSQFLATKLVDQLQTNPQIPVRAVKSQLESNLEVKIHPQKAFRALQKAKKTLKGDYMDQYGDLRDYAIELKRSNPGTTVKIDVEPVEDPNMSTRVFKRIYICLGACKRGFRAIGRDLLGVDGAFMKEPASGHLLTAVGLDSNNGIYHVAYAIVESECYDSWCWFLELVASDLELDEMCNFTFISDRQKGLVSAVAKVFPVAEHRFCLRHIHENMKKNWRGVAYKNHLWACATATTVPQFEKKMALLKEFSEPAYVYLSKIPPAQWARSHFTGRALSDILLNNICEVLNRWLCEARDKPIITALEYIRQYLMKRIANVITAISKCNTPLTLGATKVFDKVKKEAMKCDVIWNGDEKYQVNGHHDDQVVVDMGAKNCSCRKWDLTGIPCKHAVAALLNMACYSQ
ncbi:uncharacterized protein [Rutidosis leptorrhynchoides]|uniref:uncharacterized protein n=1 Tax=Rutidosis leptorrhynchoides TaxID=125765 RepID=UPI003A9992D4